MNHAFWFNRNIAALVLSRWNFLLAHFLTARDKADCLLALVNAFRTTSRKRNIDQAAGSLAVKKRRKKKGGCHSDQCGWQFPRPWFTQRPARFLALSANTKCHTNQSVWFRTRYVGYSRCHSKKNHVHWTNKAFTAIPIWTMTTETHHRIGHRAS